MILLLAIVQSEDAGLLKSRLIAQGVRVTQINATGGFLAAGNAAFLTGVPDGRYEEVIEVIKATCQARTRFANATFLAPELALSSVAAISPLEVIVGGAVVFGFPVQRHVRLQGGPLPPATDVKFDYRQDSTTPDAAPDTEPEKEPNRMNLVLAIVQNEEVDAVTQALLEAGHRLTRINTAGGFLRKGNATLLIGVEAQQVDAVLGLIQANCRPRTEPNPLASGIPMYGATVFVLEASRFIRV